MTEITIHVLGTAQDAGYPQIGCKEKCCIPALNNQSLSRFPSCISLVNSSTKKYWLFDVTPDIITMAKGITKGVMPLGAVASRELIYDTLLDSYHTCAIAGKY